MSYTFEEVQLAIEAIDSSLQQLTVLNRLQAIEIDKQDEYSQRLLAIATESIQNYCLETVESVSMESVGDAIATAARKIWEGIKKAFAYIWKALTWLFTEDETEKEEKKAKHLKTQVENLLRDAKNDPKFDEVAYLTDADILEAFGYEQQSLINGEFLKTNLTEFKDTLTRLQTVYQHYSQFATTIKGAVEAKEPELSDSQSCIGLANQLKDIIKQSFDNDVLQQLKPVKSLDSKLLMERGIHLNEITVEESRAIDCFLKGFVVYYLKYKTMPDESLTDVVVLFGKDSRIKNRECKVPYLGRDELLDVVTLLESVKHERKELKEMLKRYTKVIEEASETVNKIFGSIVETNKGSEALMFISRGYLSIINSYLSSFTAINQHMKQDTNIYSRLIEENLNYYEKSKA